MVTWRRSNVILIVVVVESDWLNQKRLSKPLGVSAIDHEGAAQRADPSKGKIFHLDGLPFRVTKLYGVTFFRIGGFG